ncbi:MAG: DUF2889 domain-containing protein [Acetobacteraceae bacterium]
MSLSQDGVIQYRLLRCNTWKPRMPLSPPVPREGLHTRRIELHGFLRQDGLYDIEAQLADTKSHGFDSEDRGRVEAGEKLHGMWMRMTVDQDMRIVACEAAIDYSPYAVCPRAAPNFARLAGLTIRPGFLKEAAGLVGGTAGCTHLRELLQQVATTAFQTIGPARARRGAARTPHSDRDSLGGRSAEQIGDRPRILNTCVAYSTDSPVVRRRWPHLFTGEQKALPAEGGP